MIECRGCIEKGREPRCWVEHQNMVCCDCAFPTPQDRQRKLLELQEANGRMAKALRDEYAQVALQGLLATQVIGASDRNPSPVVTIVTLAFEFADEALKQRQK